MSDKTWLPIDADPSIGHLAVIERIMRKALPDDARISQNAMEVMRDCVSEFISFITGEAAEIAQSDKRKTINGNHVIASMESLGFENYAHVLKSYLSEYRKATYYPENA